MSNSYGASFSLHRCSELGIDKQAALQAALTELGIRRFRLMSYWNIHEATMGKYDFSELDWQFEMIASYDGQISLCIGKKQPRWPECHLPAWAHTMSKEEWQPKLLSFIEAVLSRYKLRPGLISWQLENEARLKKFGNCLDGDFSPKRFKLELAITKKLDPKHPIIMSLSNNWGIPIIGPFPDMFGTSIYPKRLTVSGKEKNSLFGANWHKLRANFIKSYTGKPTFIHELQAEPWSNKAILETSLAEQALTMSSEQLTKNVDIARRTKLLPADLWGLEWWYYQKLHGHPELWNAARKIYASKV